MYFLYFTLGLKDDLETLTTDQMEKLDTIYFVIHYKQWLFKKIYINISRTKISQNSKHNLISLKCLKFNLLKLLYF